MAELALTMPKMSMTMEEGVMVVWLKNVGDPVKSGEPVCEVTTDKVDMEVESPFDGVLARITAQVDEVVKVGDPIGYITTDADDLLGGLFDEPEATAAGSLSGGAGGSDAPAGGRAVGPGELEATVRVPAGFPAAVPKARALAAEKGLDLGTIAPSGAWGSIRVGDVEAAVPDSNRSTSTPAESRRRRTRFQVAKVMSASALVPQFTAYADLDLEAVSAVRKTELGGAGWTAILVKAQAIALRQHPELNGFWSDGGVTAHDGIGIALAVDSPSGLLAPVLRDPDRMALNELAGEIAQLVEDVRTGSIGLERLSGGTTVFSNLGGFGVEAFNALLTPPHATALSAGAVRKKITVMGDAFGLRLGCTLGLTVDHRVADGADAARYLATLKEVIGDPQRLL